ncbi:hypothetical protein [Pseudomonas sp. LD120]|uniref:hypothetical protein n=1 Tax=Pseudomonas sp. LD120 TaxID=485751 RepID=UPI0021150627|nr:hypothetical protein [Pseudomonas sp. LD120]
MPLARHLLCLITLGLSLASGAQTAMAAAPACPSNDLPTFLRAFASSPQLQQAFTDSPLIEQRPARDEYGREITTRHKLTGDTRHLLSLLDPQAQARAGLQSFWESQTLVLHDPMGDVVQAFVFQQGACWQLVRVEQWSMTGLLDQDAPANETALQRQMRKADLFLGYGGREQYLLTGYFFDLGQQLLLDAARHGSAKAAVQAVSLGYSGMAPALKPGEPEELLRPYAPTDAEAALMLSMYYCDPLGDGSVNKCQQPRKSEELVLRTARELDSATAYYYLGSGYAEGQWGTADGPRALACYQEAIKRGDLNSIRPLTWWTKKGETPAAGAQCLPAPSQS